MNNPKLHIGLNSNKKQKNDVNRTNSMSLFEKINNWLIMNSTVKINELAVLFRLLATMIQSGLNIIKSLNILEQQIQNKKLKLLIGKIKKDVESGSTLSQAMGKYPETFGEAQIGMIYAGEASGKLNNVLNQLATQIEKSASITGKIKGAMIYPIVIILVIIGVGITMMIFVVPKIAEVFASANATLPLLTRILISMSNFTISKTFGIFNIIYVFIIIGFLFMLFLIWKKTNTGKYLWDKLMLKLPIFGGIFQKVALSKFCRGLSAMTTSGISIIKALKIISNTVGNEVYRQRIMLIAYDVKKGIFISDNIQEDTHLFPPMVVSMIGVGEKTAQLHQITDKIADFYEEEVDNLVSNLSKLMEPLIIIVIGVLAGLMIGALMLPLMQMSEVASNAS